RRAALRVGRGSRRERDRSVRAPVAAQAGAGGRQDPYHTRPRLPAGEIFRLRIRSDTLRRQLVVWLAVPLGGSGSISTYIDYDIANQFVTAAYDRSLVDSVIDIGKQIKVREGRIQADLPEVVLEMLVTGQPGQFFYLITGPGGEFIAGHKDLPLPPDSDADKATYYDAEYQGKPLRIAALHLPLEGDSSKGMVLVQVAETVTARTDYARQIMLRMMLPQVVLILLAALAVWYAVGRGLAPLPPLHPQIANRSP